MISPLLKLFLAGWLMVLPAVAAIPPEVQSRLDAMIRRLDSAMKPDDYPHADYFRDLTELGKSVPEDLVKELSASAPDFEAAVILMAAACSTPDYRKKTEELGRWYGVPANKVHRELRGIKDDQEWADFQLRFLRKQVVGVEPLREEHAVPGYRYALEAWIMSPPSSELRHMGPNLRVALGKIANPRSLPLYVSAFKRAAAGEAEDRGKRSQSIPWLHLIAMTPGEGALDALLECHRHAIEKGFVGSGIEGISREIVRILSSRLLMADQAQDPVYVEKYRKNGWKMHPPEEIPLSGTHWVAFKPVIEKRLSGKDAHLSADDTAILKAALEVMPQKK